ncbi:ABC transporter permease [Dactylosporangium roseum]|uniref:ABC transporter permease n=1 Tax=Dactylosporangium roseum TaxID=47989 RepID=A0ABY5ZAN0_9ACTN|nr:ABC transporter permease [Dactylosporangium roseum]UWZ39099.1 ABC transporter permease [Dactylosporangium roseum]
MLAVLRKRVTNMVVVVFLVISGMFFLLHLAPASPANQLPPAVAADPQALAEYRASLGLDRNIFIQYWNYLTGLLRGDFGRSLYDHSSVLTSIGRALPVTLELGLLAGVGSMVPGILLGIWAAVRRGEWVDGAARVVTVLSLSVPAYWLAVLSLLFVGQRYPDLLPSAGGFVRFTEQPIANLQVLLLPSFVLGLGTFALVARALRASLTEVMSADYVGFAAAMGMPRRRLLGRVAVRNAIIPTLTVMGVLLGGLISGTVLVESIFAIPGLGHLMVTAYLRGDYPLALGCSLVTAAIFLGLNLIVDLLNHLVDPRTLPGRQAPTGAKGAAG